MWLLLTSPSPLVGTFSNSTTPFFTKYIPSVGVSAVMIMNCVEKKRCSRESITCRMKPDSHEAKKEHFRTIAEVMWTIRSDRRCPGSVLVRIICEARVSARVKGKYIFYFILVK